MSMIRLVHLAVFLFVLLAPATGAACPDPLAVPGHWQAMTGRNLWSPKVFAVTAGGDVRLYPCGFGRSGFVRQPPDFVFELSRMGRYDRLHLRANAECDTVLLVRAPSGRWFFDDDSGTGTTASLSLGDPMDGSYHVWVGSFGPEGCVARLTLETF
jgi:hypothetical protein